MPPQRIATIDIGTNTALLLVAEVTGGRLVPLHEEGRVIRLGKGVDRTRRIRPEAMARLKAALLDYRATAERLGAAAIHVAGTSASRDAENRDALVAFVRAETGLDYDILSGADEAALCFAGATSAFPLPSGPCVVFDIGGGSTEIVVGEARTGAVSARHSLDVGTVRLTERCFTRQPPCPEEIDAARRHIDDALAGIAVPPGLPVIGAAGTAVVLARLHTASARLPDDGVTLSADAVTRWRARLLGATHAEVLALGAALLQGRADVFPVGVLLFERLMAHLVTDVVRVSPRSLRHGLALRAAQPPRPADAPR